MYTNGKYNLKKIKKYRMYRRVLNGGNFGAFEWNINKNEMFISEKVKEITGYKCRYIKNIADFINTIAYKEDKLLAMKDLNDHINGALQFYQSTFRIRTQNGEIRWVLLKGKMFKDKTGSCSLLSGVMADVTENKILEGCDSLTKIPNRAFFFEKLNNSIRMNKIHNKKGALVYIDIDNFKTLNDTFGHHLGDMILKLFCQSVITLLGKHGELARLGGDEFVILIHNFSDIKEIEEICNKIFQCIKKPFQIMDNQIHITASLGVTVFPDDSSDTDELLKLCDFAMYKSKNKGKNMFKIQYFPFIT